MSKKSRKHKASNAATRRPTKVEASAPTKRLKRKLYDKDLRKLHIELAKLQATIQKRGLKVVVIFEGRDAAGKGGVIKRIIEPLNPRVVRVVALPAPTGGTRRSGTSSVTSRTCRREAKWSCSTEAGTTEPVWSTSWATLR